MWGRHSSARTSRIVVTRAARSAAAFGKVLAEYDSREPPPMPRLDAIHSCAFSFVVMAPASSIHSWKIMAYGVSTEPQMSSMISLSLSIPRARIRINRGISALMRGHVTRMCSGAIGFLLFCTIFTDMDFGAPSLSGPMDFTSMTSISLLRDLLLRNTKGVFSAIRS